MLRQIAARTDRLLSEQAPAVCDDHGGMPRHPELLHQPVEFCYFAVYKGVPEHSLVFGTNARARRRDACSLDWYL